MKCVCAFKELGARLYRDTPCNGSFTLHGTGNGNGTGNGKMGMESDGPRSHSLSLTLSLCSVNST